MHRTFLVQHETIWLQQLAGGFCSLNSYSSSYRSGLEAKCLIQTTGQANPVSASTPAGGMDDNAGRQCSHSTQTHPHVPQQALHTRHESPPNTLNLIEPQTYSRTQHDQIIYVGFN